MVRSFKVVLVASALLMTGCPSEDGTSPNNIVIDRDGGNNSTNSMIDMGNSMPGDAGNNTNSQPDMAPPDMNFDLAVDMPGFMHGEWELQRASDDGVLATLAVRHPEGDTNLAGTYQMVEPEPKFGELGGTTWIDDTFTTSWTVDIDDTNEQFGLSACTASDDNTLACRYSSSVDGSVIDANLLRQP